MEQIIELQRSAKEYAEYGRKMLLFSFTAHNYDARRAYLDEARRYQIASARQYRGARDLMGISA